MGVGGGCDKFGFSIRIHYPNGVGALYVASPLYLDRCLDGNEDLGTFSRSSATAFYPSTSPLSTSPQYIDATHAANSYILTTSPFLTFSPASSSLAVPFFAVLFLLPDLYFQPFSSFLRFSVVVSSSLFFLLFFQFREWR